MAFFPDVPRLIIGRKKLNRGKKGATKQSRINPNKGIKDNRTSMNNKRAAMRNDPIPTRSAVENGIFLELIDFVEPNIFSLLLNFFLDQDLLLTTNQTNSSLDPDDSVCSIVNPVCIIIVLISSMVR